MHFWYLNQRYHVKSLSILVKLFKFIHNDLNKNRSKLLVLVRLLAKPLLLIVLHVKEKSKIREAQVKRNRIEG